MVKKRVDRGIYQVSTGVFEVAVSTGRQPGGRYGQVFRRHRGTLTSARAFRRTLLGEVADGQHVGGGMTVDELFDAWLADLERLGRSPKTISGYRNDARTYWRPAIGAKRVTGYGLAGASKDEDNCASRCSHRCADISRPR